MKLVVTGYYNNRKQFVVIFLLFNMYMPTMRADDVVYASRLDELGYLGASIKQAAETKMS
ncbi:hypothetical protein EfmJHP36_15000 [Enterococcus faecium]|nr:hypothetical protein EfmJHP36_15000 [Enterococcus faecium]